MHIELLWVIPIISFAIFLFIVAYQAQKGAERRSKTSILSREVALYNAGQEMPKLADVERNEERLKELEKAINLMIDMVGRHQTVVPEKNGSAAVGGESTASAENEVNELKEKLRSVFKEYDIVLSENYTLRAKVKQLSRQLKEPSKTGERTVPVEPPSPALSGESVNPASPELHLYDDTRLINLAKMEAEDRSKPA